MTANHVAASEDVDPMDALAEEFLARRRRGERATVEDYAARHPELVERIRAFFPALVAVEDLKPATADQTGSLAGATVPGRGGPLERLGDYRILREVGRGGMGVVYEAEQESLGRRVALKVLAAGAIVEPKQLLRFHREAKAAARLHHTNIVPVFGVGDCDGVHYYVMQFIQGLGLDEVLEEVKRLRGNGSTAGRAAGVAQSLLTGTFANRSEPLVSPRPESARGARSLERAPLADSGRGETVSSSSHLADQSQSAYPRAVARLGVQAAEALEYAHAQGVLHRDVKPSNLLLDSHGILWITDFGLAKASDSADLTHTGDIVGTVRYMAPERFQGRCDARADIYALGLTLYELLTLQPAFDAADRHTLIEQVTRGVPARLRRLAPGIPRDLETIVQKTIERDPAHRYATAGELADDLRRFLEDRPVSARPVGPVERLARWGKRNPVVATLTAAVFGLLLVVATVSLVMTGRVQQKADEARAEAIAAGQARDEQAQARQEAEKANAALRASDDRLRRILYASQINLAQNAWEANNLGRANELLDQVRPAAGESDLRGWEWHFFHRRLHPERINVALPFSVGLDVPLAGNGSLVAVPVVPPRNVRGRPFGLPAAEIKLFDMAAGKERLTIPDVRDGQTNLALTADWGHVTLSGDGTKLALALIPSGAFQADRSVAPVLKVYDTTTGKPVFTATLSERAADIVFSPDGRRICASTPSAANPLSAHVWDLESGQEVAAPSAWNLAFGPDGARIVGLVAVEGTPTLWRSAGMQSLGSFTFDGLTQARWTAAAKVWDVRTGQEPFALGGDPLRATGRPAFSLDGRQIAIPGTTADDGRRLVVGVWDAASGRRLHTLDALGLVNALTYTPDGRRLIARIVLPEGTTKDSDPVKFLVWDTESGQLIHTFSSIPAPLVSGRPSLLHRWLAVSPDSGLLAVPDRGGVTVWDLAKGQARCTLKGHTKLVRALAFTTDGRRLVTMGGGELRVWGVTGNEPLTLVKRERIAIGLGDALGGPLPGFGSRFVLNLTSDGRRVVLLDHGPAGQDGEVKVFDTADGRVVFTAPVPPPAQGRNPQTRIAVSHNGRRLAVQGSQSTIQVWDVEARRELFAIQETGSSFVLSPDGIYLAAAQSGRSGKDGTVVRVVEAASGRQVWSVTGLPRVTSMAYSSDGRRLFVWDGGINAYGVKVLDAATGRELTAIPEAYSPVISPDGRRFVTRRTNVMKMWDADTGRELLTFGGMTTFGDLAFSPDGRRLVGVGSMEAGPGRDLLVKVWDADTGRELLAVPTRVKNPARLAFRPDGHTLVVTGVRADGPTDDLAVEVFDGTPR